MFVDPLGETAISLIDRPLDGLMDEAARLRDAGFGPVVTWSRKVFIPLTLLCRDTCRYCTFAKSPGAVPAPYLSPDEVLSIARAGKAAGCTEALFTLGDKPELRYRVARDALAALGHDSTIDYLAAMCRLVRDETGLLAHANPGAMTAAEIARLRSVSVSQGMMLESAAARLCQPGGPHHGCPDKLPEVRLATLRAAGAARVPFTTGLLIGIGETRAERIEALVAIRDLHREFGHIQEIIIQNFRAKPDTRMAASPEPGLDELLWTIAVARLLFGADMTIQAPPNLSPDVFPALLGAGLNDWGGVSPVTPDHVNPEAPWPEIDSLARATALAGKTLVERLAIHPPFALRAGRWVDDAVRPSLRRAMDADGLARTGGWAPGTGAKVPRAPAIGRGDPVISRLLASAAGGAAPDEGAMARLFRARGPDVEAVCEAADALRRDRVGEAVGYVVNRNINYTNICTYRCGFCAFSKGPARDASRDAPYLLDLDGIARRAAEAWDRGGTEVCLQGGIHPTFTGETYLAICRAVKRAAPDIHIHAFSPLEVSHGARTLGLSVGDFLDLLSDAGLDSLPGTAAEILDDGVRAELCPDKLASESWLAVIEAAHRAGLRTTATIMFGHIDGAAHWARHLARIRDLQERTGGFTEFVPLPFVHMEAPLWKSGRARSGPTFRETLLMHAVSRLALDGAIPHIQASWVKLGPDGVRALLAAGVDDLGGTLMNESISRAAGTVHGQEFGPAAMEALIRAAGRVPRHRTTLYGDARRERRDAAFAAAPLAAAG